MQRSSRNLSSSSSRRTPHKPGTSPSLGASTARRGGGLGASNNNKFAMSSQGGGGAGRMSSSQKRQTCPSTSSSTTVQLPSLRSKSTNQSRTNTSNKKPDLSVNTSAVTSSPPSLSSPSSKTPRSQQLSSSSARLAYLNQSTTSPPSRSVRSPRTQQQLGGLGNKSLNASVSRRNHNNKTRQLRQGTSPSTLSIRSPNSNRPLQHQDSFRSSTTANTQAATSTAGTSVHQQQQNQHQQRSSNFLTSPTSQNGAASVNGAFNSSFSASSMFPSSFIVGGNANKSAAELVAQAEINASLKQQIQATESLNTQRQSKIDECVVMDAALHSRATQLRRKNITLDPLRHQVSKLTMEVRRLEKELGEIEEVLEVPERKLKQLERKQKETEESYIDRFELRPHRLSESVVRNVLGGLTKKDYEEEQARSQKQNPLTMSTEDVHAAMKKHDDFDDPDDPVEAHLRKHRYDESHFAEIQKRKKEQEEALEQEERDRAEESIQRDRERNDKEMSLRRIHNQRWFNGAGDGLLGGGATENYLLEQDFEGSLIPISIRQDVPDPRLLAVVGDEYDSYPKESSADLLDAQVTRRKYAWEDIPIKPTAVSMMIMDRREEGNNKNIYDPSSTNNNKIHNDALALLPVDGDDDEVRDGSRGQEHQKQNQGGGTSSTSTSFDAEKWMLKHVREVEATCPADASIARQSSVHEGVNRRHRTRFVRERMRQEVFEGERGKRGGW